MIFHLGKVNDVVGPRKTCKLGRSTITAPDVINLVSGFSRLGAGCRLLLVVFCSLIFSVSNVVAAGTVVGWGNSALADGPVLTNVVAVAAGYEHSLALAADGTVVGFGKNSFGQITIPAGLTNAMAIAAGGYHSLALRSNGTVVAWGDIGSGQNNVPSGLNGVAAISDGFGHCLALRTNGTVVAWGQNNAGQTNVPVGLSNVIVIAAGGSHSLALKSDGTLVAWGSGQTNTGLGDDFGQAMIPAGLSNVIAISAGQDHSLALKSDGTVVAWGNNQYGQTNIPPDLTNVVQVHAGSFNNAVLKSDGTVVSWGYNNYGQSTPPPGLRNVTTLAAGWDHALAVYDGSPVIRQLTSSTSIYSGRNTSVFVWAGGLAPFTYQWLFENSPIAGATNSSLNLTNMQISNAGNYRVLVTNLQGSVFSTNITLSVQASPPIVTSQPTNQTVLRGTSTQFLVSDSGSAPVSYQWRFDGSEIPGATNSALTLLGVQLTAAGSYDVVLNNSFGSTTSSNAVLAVRPSGVVTWGYNCCGVAPAASNFIAIDGGHAFYLALKDNGTVAAWGSDQFGECDVPADTTNVMAIVASAYNSLALKMDGSVSVWGRDLAVKTNLPAGLSNLVAIAAGMYHGLGLRTNGTIIAWGRGTLSLNVDPDFGQAMVPDGLSNVVAMAAGYEHSVALKRDGSVVCWGLNNFNQTNTPTGLSNVVAIAAGRYHTLALRDDGTVVAWGAGTIASGYPHLGQSAVPADLSNVVAIAAGDYHSIALRNDGTMRIWGAGTVTNSSAYQYGQAVVPVGLTNVVAIGAGEASSVALVGDPVFASPDRTLGFSNGMFSIPVATMSGRTYEMQFRDDLQQDDWTRFPLIPGSGAIQSFIDPGATNSQRFYRIQRW